ncbi:GL10949 [Drosophila persimilis]|uniref:Serine protease inhibitor 42Dd n=2 Tax=pseudoobscura subgroup TaxID=32358 RepID=A0A6I8USS8_DROPS|nr:serine protease inhibitor 42Dd [Drosophila pseudoobscura]XP_002015583.1 serine protease inhibitor 42Dd [Drosophila persimilis]EDW31473.1 GL10949 [Drosophila persimilis]
MAVIVSCLLLFLVSLSHAKTNAGFDPSIDRNLLAADLYNAVGADHLNENVVISPASIQSSMALAFVGAKGQTASELQQGLRLGPGDVDQVSQRFGSYQQSLTRDNNLRLANNIYINENLEFKGSFRDVAQRQFDSNIDKLDFHPPYNKRTADGINRAIATKTNGKITDILAAELLNDRTEGVIVNGVSFAAPWQKAFKLDKTEKRSFRTGNGQSVRVDTMWTLQNFNYAEVRTLDAKVVELPYQNADFSMLLLLPNRKDGLRSLQQSLVGKNLLAEIGEMSQQKVEVLLPKFSVTFGLGLEKPFKQLGVHTMFSRDGDFSNMYRMFVSHFINAVEHKANVEVSEAGVEQPLESGVLKGLFSRSKKFEADHPFVFAVKYRDSIAFIGHIANYAYV